MWTPTTRANYSLAGLSYGSDLPDAEWAILGQFLLADLVMRDCEGTTPEASPMATVM